MYCKLKSSSEEDDQCHFSANRVLRHAPLGENRPSRMPRLLYKNNVKSNRHWVWILMNPQSHVPALSRGGDLKMEAIGATYHNYLRKRQGRLHSRTLPWYPSRIAGSQNWLASASITPSCSSNLKSRQASSELIASSLGVYRDSTLYTEDY